MVFLRQTPLPVSAVPPKRSFLEALARVGPQLCAAILLGPDIVSHLIFPPTLRDQHPSLHFTEENRKEKKDKVMCPRSRRLSDSH